LIRVDLVVAEAVVVRVEDLSTAGAGFMMRNLLTYFAVGWFGKLRLPDQLLNVRG